MSGKRSGVGAMFEGTLRSYILGFVLAAILTAASFATALGLTPGTTTFVILVVLAVVQIGVHLILFLHLHASSRQRWNFMALGFAAWVMLIMVGGSLWIMWHLRANMML